MAGRESLTMDRKVNHWDRRNTMVCEIAYIHKPLCSTVVVRDVSSVFDVNQCDLHPLVNESCLEEERCRAVTCAGVSVWELLIVFKVFSKMKCKNKKKEVCFLDFVLIIVILNKMSHVF